MSDSQLPFAAVFTNSPDRFDRVWPADRIAELNKRCRLYDHRVSDDTFADHVDELKDLEVIFSTWGMTGLTDEQVSSLPNLKAVFYAAGSVQRFARPFLQNGVEVFSAWVANGIPVAEFTVAQILLSCKGYFRNARELKSRPDPSVRKEHHRGEGIYDATVALIGFGVIARKVAELLKPFSISVLVVDPFVDDDTLQSFGVERVTLEEAFSRALVVSNHLPNIPPTVDMMGAEHFNSMRPDATFINTGRGRQIREPDMIDVLKERSDLTALLDVTFPEPPPVDSPLHSMPNVHLSTHIAGSINKEVVRMADFMLEEFDLWQAGKDTRYGVTLDMLETMA